jgi:hypothetical protein
MNTVEQLLKLDKKKLEVLTKDVEIKRLGVTFTCQAIGLEEYNEIQESTINMDKKGNIKGFNLGSGQLRLILAGVPTLKDKELLKYFGVQTPFELIKKLFNVGEANLLAETISKISGIDVIENADAEIKN